jgi:tRNA(fMet)-specific endonuclease VapC
MLKYMLDTNIVIYTIKHRPSKLRKAFKQHERQMCLSAVTMGELIYGAEKSTQVERNLSDIEGFAALVEVMPFNTTAAIHFGQLRAELHRAGKPLGPYDMMIAGHARALGLTLVTNNAREFKRVPGLRVINWA